MQSASNKLSNVHIIAQCINLVNTLTAYCQCTVLHNYGPNYSI